MNSNFFQADDVSFSYSRKPLCLSSVTFSMNKYEKILVLATKEMGKTTFLSVMSSFEKLHSGNIYFEGKKISEISDESKKFSFLPSNPVLFENKNTIDNIKIILKNVDKNFIENEKIKTLIEFFNINNCLQNKVKKLTLIQRRKIALLRSELKEPKILFLDDQYQNLDENEFGEMNRIYNKILSDEKKSVIFTIDCNTLKNNRAFFKKFDYAKVLYLVDSKIFEFSSLNEFESNILNVNQLNFLSNDIFKINAILLRENDEYYFNIGENNYRINNELKNYFEKLNLKNGDEEDIIFVFKEKFSLDELNEEKINYFLKNNILKIFSNIDGSKIV